LASEETSYAGSVAVAAAAATAAASSKNSSKYEAERGKGAMLQGARGIKGETAYQRRMTFYRS